MNGIRVAVTDEPIDAAKVAAELADREMGAQVLFTGVVRATNHGKRVVAVSYDAFSPLAETTLAKICEEARTASGSPMIVIVVHRRGKLAVGEASVVIGVSSPHRAEAYEASRYVIEEIKVRVPIWKKEHYENGETDWLRGHALCSHGPSNHRHDSGGRPIHPHGPR